MCFALGLREWAATLGKFPPERIIDFPLTDAGFKLNRKISDQAIPADRSIWGNGKPPGYEQSNNQNERVVRPTRSEFSCQ
jgi:hypothetical protein